MEENIRKAHCAFFHFGSIGVFQGDISPMSSKEVIESCVMPVLFYGSENWILTDVDEEVRSFSCRASQESPEVAQIVLLMFLMFLR